MGVSCISIIHTTLNLLEKKKKRTAHILYACYDNKQIVAPLINKMSGLTLHSLSIYQKKSFLSRKNTINDINFNNIIRRPFIGLYFNEKKFRESFANHLYTQQKNFLKKNMFSAIVCTDEFSMPHSMLTKAANQLGLWTFGIQHGQIYTKDSQYEKGRGYVEYKKRKNKDDVVDYMIVYSKKEKDYLTKNSPHLKAEALGCPRYDHFAQNRTKEEKKKIAQSLGIKLDKKKKHIVWATQTHHNDEMNPEENKQNCKLLFPYFLKNKKDFQFFIKLHPNEDQKAPLYKKWNKKYHNVASIIKGKKDMTKVLDVADGLIVKHSAVGSEAILAGKPLVFLDPNKGAEIDMYTEEGFNKIIRTEEDLEKVFRSLFSKEEQKKFSKLRQAYIKRRFAHFGNATAATVSFIQNQIKNKKQKKNVSKEI